MKKRLYYLALFIICFFNSELYAQIQPKNYPLQVLSPRPKPQQNTLFDENCRFDNEGHVVITVKFDQEVKVSTVEVGSTLVLSFENDKNAGATLSWADNNKTLTITTTKSFNDIGGVPNDRVFSLRLRGTVNYLSPPGTNKIPSKGIQSVRGRYLDGDYDGKDGGNYVVGIIHVD